MRLTRHLWQRATALTVALTAFSAHGQECSDTLFRDSFEALAQNRFEVELVISDLGSRLASFQLDGGEVLNVNSDGVVCFATEVQGGENYTVAITEQPASGDVCGGDVTGVATARVSIPISCTFSRTEWDQFDWDGADWN
jgi:hypothetical protein